MAKEIRMSGSGGQGVVLAGIILAEAAGIYDENEAIHAQDYGGAMRGGAVRSEVIIADKGEEIEHPAATKSDILLAMTQAAADRWSTEIKEGSIVIYDSTFIENIPEVNAKTYKAPLTATIRQRQGRDITSNIAGLGFLVRLTGVVNEDSLEKAIMQRIPRGTEKLNMEALQIGYELADSVK